MITCIPVNSTITIINDLKHSTALKSPALWIMSKSTPRSSSPDLFLLDSCSPLGSPLPSSPESTSPFLQFSGAAPTHISEFEYNDFSIASLRRRATCRFELAKAACDTRLTNIISSNATFLEKWLGHVDELEHDTHGPCRASFGRDTRSRSKIAHRSPLSTGSIISSRPRSPPSRNDPTARSPSPDSTHTSADNTTGPLLEALREITSIATDLIYTSVTQLMAESEICEGFIEQIWSLGRAWDKHSDCPSRVWYIQCLLSVANLSRVCKWWKAEQEFWHFDIGDDEAKKPLLFAMKLTDKEDYIKSTIEQVIQLATDRLEHTGPRNQEAEIAALEIDGQARLSPAPHLPPFATSPDPAHATTLLPLSTHPHSINFRDIEIIKHISNTTLSSVFLAKRKTSGGYLAIKTLRKVDVLPKNQVAYIKQDQHRIIFMRQMKSPFVGELYSAFQSGNNVFMVMEYVDGEDMGALVRSLGSLSEEWTRTYVAEIVRG